MVRKAFIKKVASEWLCLLMLHSTLDGLLTKVSPRNQIVLMEYYEYAVVISRLFFIKRVSPEGEDHDKRSQRLVRN